MKPTVITTIFIFFMICVAFSGCIDNGDNKEDDKEQPYADKIVNLNATYINIPDENDSLPIEYTFSLSEMNVSKQYEKPYLFQLKNDQMVILVSTDEVNLRKSSSRLKKGDGESDHLYFMKIDSDGQYLVQPKLIINTTKCDKFYLHEDADSNLHLFWVDQREIDFEPGCYPMYGKLYYKKLNSNGDTIIDDKILINEKRKTSDIRFQGIIEITSDIYQFSFWEENLTTSVFNMSNTGDILNYRVLAPTTFGSPYAFQYDNSGDIDICWKDENNLLIHEHYNSATLELIKRDVYRYDGVDYSSFPKIFEINGEKYLQIMDNESNIVLFNLIDTLRDGLIINFQFPLGYSIIPSLNTDEFYSTSEEGIHYQDDFSCIHITKFDIEGNVNTFNAPMVTILGYESEMLYGPSIWLAGVEPTTDNGLNLLFRGNDGINNFFIIVLNLDQNLEINFIKHVDLL